MELNNFAEVEPSSEAKCLEKGKSERFWLSLPSNNMTISNINTHTTYTHTYGLGLFRASSAHDHWTQTTGFLNRSFPFYPRLGAIWGLLTHRKSRLVQDMGSFPLRFPREQCQVCFPPLFLQGHWGLHTTTCWLFPDHPHTTCLP